MRRQQTTVGRRARMSSSKASQADAAAVGNHEFSVTQSGVEVVQDPKLSKDDRPLWVAVEAFDLARSAFRACNREQQHRELRKEPCPSIWSMSATASRIEPNLRSTGPPSRPRSRVSPSRSSQGTRRSKSLKATTSRECS